MLNSALAAGTWGLCLPHKQGCRARRTRRGAAGSLKGTTRPALSRPRCLPLRHQPHRLAETHRPVPQPCGMVPKLRRPPRRHHPPSGLLPPPGKDGCNPASRGKPMQALSPRPRCSGLSHHTGSSSSPLMQAGLQTPCVALMKDAAFRSVGVSGPSRTVRARRQCSGTSASVSVTLGCAVTRSLRWLPARITFTPLMGASRMSSLRCGPAHSMRHVFVAADAENTTLGQAHRWSRSLPHHVYECSNVSVRSAWTRCSSCFLKTDRSASGPAAVTTHARMP